MCDLLIIGGGVIGLSLAYEFAARGGRVQLVDQGDLAREASWAGAGILPPASPTGALHPYDQLRALSYSLHPQWAERLTAETGIDTGYRRCGGLYLARTPGEAAALRGFAQQMHAEGITAHPLALADVAVREPALAPAVAAQRFRAAYELPGECQLRNPRHLRALVQACRQRNVDLLPQTPVTDFVLRGERIEGVRTTAGVLRAETYCVASGAWTRQLLAQLDLACDVLPIKGQMILYRCQRKPFERVLNEGNRYLVPRDDGYVLAGSTEEEAGFDKRTTTEALAELQAFAAALVPELDAATVEKSWAGLRPASYDGFPYLGRLPRWDNAFVAAGHFRSGLYLSPGTAVVLCDVMLGGKAAIDLSPFAPGR